MITRQQTAGPNKLNGKNEDARNEEDKEKAVTKGQKARKERHGQWMWRITSSTLQPKEETHGKVNGGKKQKENEPREDNSP